MNRNITEIVTIDNQVILKRFYKKGFHELGSHLFYLPEMPSDEEFEKILKTNILQIIKIIHYAPIKRTS